MKGDSATKKDLCDRVANVTIFHFCPDTKAPVGIAITKYRYFVQGKNCFLFQGEDCCSTFN